MGVIVLTHPGLSPYGRRLIMSQLMCSVRQEEMLSMNSAPKRWRRFHSVCPLFYFLHLISSCTFVFCLQEIKQRLPM